MKRYYRNRFILGAMLSFLILLLLAAAGIYLFSYQQMERETNDFLRIMQEGPGEGAPPFSQDAPPPMFGYSPNQRMYPSGFYDITLNADGEIESIQRNGIIEEAEDSVRAYARQAAAQKASGGKIGSYKYGATFREDGTSRIIMLDISIQLQALYHTLRSALLVGVVLSLALFLILLPVSSKIASIFIRNAERQKQFITDAGHDLKTPVAIIRSSLDVMELTQGQNKWSQNIRCQTERMERLIGELLMLSKLDETSVTGKRAPLDLAAMLREEEQHYQPLTAQRGIAWEDALPDRLPIQGDEKAVRQMLNLLLDNAAQYTNDGGRIALSGQIKKKNLVLEISNTVEQLPECPPQELMERFVRGNTARTQKSGGAGIGLSAAKRIVEMHKGTMTIEYRGEHVFCVSASLPHCFQRNRTQEMKG